MIDNNNKPLTSTEVVSYLFLDIYMSFKLDYDDNQIYGIDLPWSTLVIETKVSLKELQWIVEVKLLWVKCRDIGFLVVIITLMYKLTYRSLLNYNTGLLDSDRRSSNESVVRKLRMMRLSHSLGAICLFLNRW